MNIAFITSCCLARDGVGNSIRSIIRGLTVNNHFVTLYHMDDRAQMDNTASSWGNNREYEYRNEYANLLHILSDRLFSTPEDNRSDKDRQVWIPNFFEHDLYIFEFAFYYPLLELAQVVENDKVVFHYNGITPPHMFKTEDPYRKLAQEALSKHYLLDYGKLILVHSNYIRKSLERDYPPVRGKIRVLPISVSPDYGEVSPDYQRHSPDCQRQKKSSIQSQATTKPLTDNDKFTLLYTGRLSGNKNIPLLVKALAKLNEEVAAGKAYHLILAGAHSRTTDQSYKDELIGLSSELEIADKVHFVSDPDDEKLISLYKKADLFVTASLHEGFCIPVAEALSCRLPAVVAKAGATPETLGKGGLTFDPSSSDNCAATIKRALNKSVYKELQEMTEAESVRFTDETLAKKLNSIIGETTLSVNNDCHMSKNNLRGQDSPDIPPDKREDSAYQSSNGLNDSQRIRLLRATAVHSFTYSDRFHIQTDSQNVRKYTHRLVEFVKWLRRKMTLPQEVSVVRKFSQYQSNFNETVVEEIAEVKKQIFNLKNADSS